MKAIVKTMSKTKRRSKENGVGAVEKKSDGRKKIVDICVDCKLAFSVCPHVRLV